MVWTNTDNETLRYFLPFHLLFTCELWWLESAPGGAGCRKKSKNSARDYLNWRAAPAALRLHLPERREKLFYFVFWPFHLALAGSRWFEANTRRLEFSSAGMLVDFCPCWAPSSGVRVLLSHGHVKLAGGTSSVELEKVSCQSGVQGVRIRSFLITSEW